MSRLHRASRRLWWTSTRAPGSINTHGLELETRAGIEHLPLPARLPADLSEPVDLVLVFTKTFHTNAALAGIAAAIGPQTWLLSLQNGLGNDRRLSEHAAEARVLVGTSSLPSDLVGPVRVRSHGRGTRSSCLRSALAFAQDLSGSSVPCLPPRSADITLHLVKAIFTHDEPLWALTRRTPAFLRAT